MPMVTALPFFSTFFLSPILVYFAKKVNPRCLQLYLFFVFFCLRSLSTMLGILTLLFFGFCANTFPPSTSASGPPHPSAPGGGGMPGHSGRRGNVGAAARAAAARCKGDRANVLLARTNKTHSATPSNREIQHQNCSDEILPINELIRANKKTL